MNTDVILKNNSDFMKVTDQKLRQNVCPVFADHGEMCGVGVIVNGYFVTAAHVLGESGSLRSTCIDGKKFILDREDAEIFVYTDEGTESICDEHSLDLAAFDLSGKTELRGLDFRKDIDSTEGLTGITIRTKSARSSTIFSYVEEHYLLACDVKVDEVSGNFLCTHTDPMLRKGDSGSPLVQGDKVVGILCAGREDTDFCVFLKSAVIMDLLHR